MESINYLTKLWADNKGLKTWYEKETTSTNAKAKDLGKNFDVYLTDHQSHGRGRGSAQWHDSQSGAGLLSSWTFQLNQPPQPIASPLFGIALYMALKHTWLNGEFSLKAPNDIYLGEKKLAGLLIEGISMGSSALLVVGLGLNVHDHPRDLDIATHLASQTKVTTLNWHKFLDTLYSYFNEMAVLSTDTEIPTELCHQLRTALNLFPMLEEPVTEVDGHGNIITPDAVIRWFDL